MSDAAVREFFAGLEQRIDRSKVQGLNAVYQFHITGEGGGDWHIRFVDGEPQVVEGQADDPSITLTAAVETWSGIVSGEINGQTAFLTGKLKIQGDMTLAMKLQSILQP